MAVQLINKGKRVVTFCPNLRIITQRLRTFSSSAKRSPLISQVDVEERAESSGTEPILLWPDPNLDFLSPKDKRLPLPGNIGPSKQFTSQKVEEKSSTTESQFFVQLPADRHKDIINQAFRIQREDMAATDHNPLDLLECVAQECPQLIKREFVDLFFGRDLNSSILTVVTLSQKTVLDMSEWSQDIENEREELTTNFIMAAEKICEKLQEVGFWADFIDPASGRPYLGPYTNATMFETDDRYRYFGFTIEDLGCCKVIKHHLWGTHAFVGCIFTNAPISDPTLTNLLSAQSKEQKSE